MNRLWAKLPSSVPGLRAIGIVGKHKLVPVVAGGWRPTS
jgi:hypothetical protein